MQFEYLNLQVPVCVTALISFVLMLCVSNICTMNGIPDNALEVKTQQGSLRGKCWKTWKGRSFTGFTGIPYAKPPVGELRFKAPVPADSWQGVLDATKFHDVCPQIDIFTEGSPIIGNEDCLYLNVYTPQLPSLDKELLPVMFYIHGGSFIMGSGRPDWIGPDILLEKDVVLVVVNYRLGALGFISTGDEIVPGNNGLKDQNLALKWVSQNIAHFGGDPDRITIFGNSAGAACTHLHMFSPLSKDLIKGAIVQSGSALAAYAITSKDAALKNANKLGEFLNLHFRSNQELIECLRKVDAYEIVKKEAKFASWDNDTTMPFRAIVEQNHEGAFLLEDPIETLQGGRAANVPLMTGITAQEAAFKAAEIFSKPDLVNKLDQYFDLIVPLSFGVTSNFTETSAAIRKFYFNQSNGNLSKSGVTDMYSDGWFLTGADILLQAHVQYSNNPIYQYLFDYRGSTTYTTLFGDPTYDYGVCHTDDLLYLLPRKVIFPEYIPNEPDSKIIEIMTTLWTNFAATGNPTPKGNSVISTTWKPVQNDNYEYLHIRNYSDINMGQRLYSDRINFWRSLPTGKINADESNQI